MILPMRRSVATIVGLVLAAAVGAGVFVLTKTAHPPRGADSGSRAGTEPPLPPPRPPIDVARPAAAPAPTAPLPKAPSALAGFTGVVRDADTGAALAKARVASRTAGGGAVMGVETDEKGTFRLANIPEGNYEVMAVAEGYLVPAPQRAEARPGGGSELAFALARGAVIAGDVRDEITGKPVAGAALVLGGRGAERSAPPFRPLKTDAGGRFAIGGVAPGDDYILEVRAQGYQRARAPLPPVGPAGLAGVRVAVTRGGRISGRVVDAGGAPVGREAHVFAKPEGSSEPAEELHRALVGEDGRFALEALADGTYLVGAETTLETTPALVPIVVVRGGAVENVDLRIEKAGPLEGRATDEAGAPLAGVEVSAERRGLTGHMRERRPARAATAADGSFRLEAGPGDFAVRARKGGYFGAEQQGVRAGAKDLALVLRKAPGGAARVAGKLAGPSGKPLTGITLRFDIAGAGDADSFDAKIGGGGELALEAVTAGRYTVSFIEPGAPEGELRVRLREIDIAGGEPADLSLEEKEPRGAVSGVVRIGAGLPQPAEPVQVNLSPAERPTERFGFAAATGAAAGDRTFRFSAVPPGKYLVRAAVEVAGGAEKHGETTIEVAPGSEARVEVTVQ